MIYLKLYFRLRSRYSTVARRQVVLYALCPFRYTPDAGTINRTGRSIDDTHDQIPALPQQPPRTPVPAVHHPPVALRHHTWHADIFIPIATRGYIHVHRTRMELHGFPILLFHITHHHRSW